MSKAGNNAVYKKNKLRELKEEQRRQDQRRNALSGRGPVGLVVAKIIDMIILVIKKIFEFLWYGLTVPTFNFVWRMLFSEFHGVFAGKEKDGDCYNTSYLRYIITILVPPVGIFLSKGLVGWPSIFISIILTFFHMFPGIIYAFIVTHNSRYADRYQAKELQKIEEAKKQRGVNHRQYGFIHMLAGIAIMVSILYMLFKLAQFISKLNDK